MTHTRQFEIEMTVEVLEKFDFPSTETLAVYLKWLAKTDEQNRPVAFHIREIEVY